MDFTWAPELTALADEARALADDLDPTRRTEDSWLVGHDRAFTERLGALGWIGMTWPPAAGGHGRSAIERFVVYEALIAAGAPLAAGWFADRQIGPSLLQYGTDDQRDRWLPDIVAGRSAWCIGMSEPDAGSDVASLRTSAVRQGDDWVVNGAKVWTSGAHLADWCYLVARTDREAPKHLGLSDLVVDMHHPGVEIRPIRDVVGGEHFCEVRFRDVPVPATHLIGAENGSFKQIMRQMEHERGGIDRLLSNRAVYDDVRRRHPLGPDDHLLRQEAATIEAGYRIGRLLVLREVLGQAPAGWSALTKIRCTELEQLVAAHCARRVGAAAVACEPTDLVARRAGRAVSYAPAYTIMGGTVDVLRNVLGERVLGLPR